MGAIILMGMPGPFELILLILAIVILFGGKKIPELMSGIGKGMKEFKKATKDDDEELSGKKEEK